MKLTQVLGFYTRYRKVQGLIRYGKHRVIPPISITLKQRVAELMVREKTNLDILDKPYLSVAQESAYNKVVEKVPFKNDKQLKQERRKNIIESFLPHYTTEELLANLDKNKRWE